MLVRTKIFAVVGLSVAAGVSCAALLASRISSVVASYQSLLSQEVSKEQKSLEMQVLFKKQVQAWKDILLRGRDPESMSKYLAEFTHLDGLVDSQAAELSSGIADPEIKSSIDEFRRAHAQLGQKYRAALDVFQKAKGMNTFEVDLMLKGQDRAPTDLIDKVVSALRKAREEHSARLASEIAHQVTLSLAGALVLFAVVLLLTIKLAAGTGRRLRQAGVLLQQIAEGEGNLQARLPEGSSDELGAIARGFNPFTAKIEKVVGVVAQTAEQIADAAERFSATSQEISANSSETSAQAAAVSAATEEINRNLQTVATSTEEMGASITEISKNAGEAAKVAGEALEATTRTNSTMAKLDESSAEIGHVIKVITSIAQQTNLLALNATIEAARAGEAGKGFAVVSNEVKELAKQTAKATEDITQRIASIQIESKGAVAAIHFVSEIIGRVNDISTTIATAVEQQSATTAEMSRNVSEAATGSREVTKNIGGVASAAENTAAGINEARKAAEELAQMSAQLRGLVAQFKTDAKDGAGPKTRTNPAISGASALDRLPVVVH